MLSFSAAAQRGPGNVVTSEGRMDVLAPQGEFRGTVYFKEVSDVAAEVEGKIVDVHFEEGDRVPKGAPLVTLDAVLLEKDLKATRADLNRYKADLEDAEIRRARVEKALQGGIETTERYDTVTFQAQALAYQVASSEARVDRLETLLEKYTVKAPFDGVVLERRVDAGEWTGNGDTVAVLAKQKVYDVVLNVPQVNLGWLDAGLEVPITINDKSRIAKIEAVIPRGDVATRTFPVKLRVTGDGLYEGMAASARLPIGEPTDALMVLRDAVLDQGREQYLFTVEDNTAMRHTVNVIGYDGLYAALAPSNLSPDQAFIVKGHERLRGGEQVNVVERRTAGSAGGN